MPVHTTVDRHPLTLAARIMLACCDNPTATRREIAEHAGCTERAAEANIAALRTAGRLAAGQPWTVPARWQHMVSGLRIANLEWTLARQDTP